MKLHAKDLETQILSVIGDGDILLIVPPFGGLYDMCVGPHILRKLAEKYGFRADLLYANMLLASTLGMKRYEHIYNASLPQMLGERMFVGSAYDSPPLGYHHEEECTGGSLSGDGGKTGGEMCHDASQDDDVEAFFAAEQICAAFVDRLSDIIAALPYHIVGCSTNILGQVNCGIALLSKIKQQRPDVVTIIGGGNCEGEMAEGIASLSPAVDYIFSGESEMIFLDFLQGFSSRKLPSQRILSGEALKDLNDLPFVDYDIFLKQVSSFLGENALKHAKIWYESSRGCWWGEKGKCRFCGEYNISFRKKSPDKRAQELRQLQHLRPNTMVFTTDAVFPYQDVLPQLFPAEAFPPLSCQLKVDTSLQDLIHVKNANIHAILPGIETFSTKILQLMNKGTTARQNLIFLRNAASVGFYVDWFMLWGFPGDRISEYEDILRMLPLIRHLQPPRKFESMQLMRFSPYVRTPQKYEISKLRPWPAYHVIYPDRADIEKLAYYYHADYPSEAREHPELILKIANEITRWRRVWENAILKMLPFAGSYIIYDRRNNGAPPKKHFVHRSRAQEVMAYRKYNESEPQQWALERQLGIVVDSWYVPLVTASPELLLQFDTENEKRAVE